MNEQIRRVAAERAVLREKATERDWTQEIELLKARVRDLRRAAMSNPGSVGDRPHDDNIPASASNSGISKSMLESLAYAQTIQIKQERPKKSGRRAWRSEVFDPTLGSDLLPDSGLKEKQNRGDA